MEKNKLLTVVVSILIGLLGYFGQLQYSKLSEIEKSLLERVPDEYMEHAHHWLILHGRYVCTARNPKCESCIISDICLRNS